MRQPPVLWSTALLTFTQRQIHVSRAEIPLNHNTRRLRRKTRNLKLAERGGFERQIHRFRVQSDRPGPQQSSRDFRLYLQWYFQFSTPLFQ